MCIVVWSKMLMRCVERQMMLTAAVIQFSWLSSSVTPLLFCFFSYSDTFPTPTNTFRTILPLHEIENSFNIFYRFVYCAFFVSVYRVLRLICTIVLSVLLCKMRYIFLCSLLHPYAYIHKHSHTQHLQISHTDRKERTTRCSHTHSSTLSKRQNGPWISASLYKCVHPVYIRAFSRISQYPKPLSCMLSLQLLRMNSRLASPRFVCFVYRCLDFCLPDPFFIVSLSHIWIDSVFSQADIHIQHTPRAICVSVYLFYILAAYMFPYSLQCFCAAMKVHRLCIYIQIQKQIYTSLETYIWPKLTFCTPYCSYFSFVLPLDSVSNSGMCTF